MSGLSDYEVEWEWRERIADLLTDIRDSLALIAALAKQSETAEEASARKLAAEWFDKKARIGPQE